MSRIRTRAWHARLMSQLLLPAMLVGMSGCGPSVRFTGTTQFATPITLSRLYVYYFLDLRTAELGRNMINEMARQLETRLEERGVGTEQHWFRDDPLAPAFISPWSPVMIPVRRVIELNAADEQRFGSEYRLIVFPRFVEGRYAYVFAWELEDARTNRIVWSTTSHGDHDRNGTSDEVAKKLLDGLIAEMDRSGLFGAAPASAPPL